ncbi:MAG: glycosyltransferase family 2 protein [Acidobacteriia bacterium]|nr:glycosyltransferase family 2 protein [Terriglobia bacterium]
MHTFSWILGLLLGAVWLHRLLDAAIGMPAIPDIARPEWDGAPSDASVTVIVPARNEQEHIEGALRSLLGLEYPRLEIIAVDDRSTDTTGRVMDRIAAEDGSGRLRVIHIEELPAGWLGKTHAMWLASQKAGGDWILFTDADVVFRPDALRRALRYVEQQKADHLVIFPTIEMRSAGERMMIAFFQALFTFGHRPWKVADPKTRDHMGVGAFNLLRRSAYQNIGTHEKLRLAVIDDMKLGELIKQNGFAQRNVFGTDLLSIHWAKGGMGVVHNLTKNMFALMLFRWPRAVGAAFLLGLFNLGPFLGLLLAHGWAKAGYGVATFVIFALYVGMSTKTKISPIYFLAHPISSVMFVFILLRSTFLTLWQGGVVWRGTKYPLEELRAGMLGGEFTPL